MVTIKESKTMSNLNMKEAVRMLSAFIEYANETKKFHDVGNYEFITRSIKEADKELEAKDREITRVRISRKAALSREVEANTNWSTEAKKWDLELEANKKIITNSIPKENVMNLARMIRADQEEANQNENFGEAEVLGEVFSRLVDLLTDSVQKGVSDE